MAGLFIAGNMVTFSRGGFLGLIASFGVLVWKLGRKSRLKVSVDFSRSAALLFILLAPGNYGLRLLSIFIPALDPVGSSDQRQELLDSFDNRHFAEIRGASASAIFRLSEFAICVTHNAFTQVSSELGFWVWSLI